MKTNGKRLVLAAMVSVVGISGTVAGQTITEDHKVIPDEFTGGGLGWSVAVSGSVAVVCAPGAEAGEYHEGAAYAIDMVTGNLIFDLVPIEDADVYYQFARSVAAEGGFAAVGAYGSPLNSPSLGAVYVFDLNTGQQVFRLTDPDPSENDFDIGFGASVAMSESVVVVGDPVDFGEPNDLAAAYAFDATTGELLFQFNAPMSETANLYGEQVAASISYAAVSEPDREAVHVYELKNGERLYTLTPPPLGDTISYAVSIGISEDFVVVGAMGDVFAGEYPGSAYVYDAPTGEYLYRLTVPETEEGFRFGWSVAVDGATAVISTQSLEGYNTVPGAVYVFDLNSGERLLKLNPSDSSEPDDFGFSVALDGSNVVVGRPWENAGAAYLFTLPPFDCPGDATGDESVDLADLNLVLANFGSAMSEGDVTGDGDVDLADLNLVLANFGSSCK